MTLNKQGMTMKVSCIEDLRMDGKELVTEELSELIKQKVVQTLDTIEKDVVITGLNKIGSSTDTSVELEVIHDIAKVLCHISFEKSELDRLHHIHPDKIKFNTFQIGDIDVPKELLETIKKELICELERNGYDYGYGDIRKCEKIQVIEITQRSNSNTVALNVEIMFDYYWNNHMTPEITETLCLTLNKSKFPLKLNKKRHISYTKIDEQELPEDDIIVMEKIDGSNIGIGFIDDDNILIQSRNKVLAIVTYRRLMKNTIVKERYFRRWEEKEYNVPMGNCDHAKTIITPLKFFDLEHIIDELIKKVIEIKNILKCNNFMVFGEIFGSSFHPNKNHKKKLHSLQYHSEESQRLLKTDRVYYSAFDILVNNETYLKYSDAIDIFEKVQLPYSKILPLQYCGNEDLLKIIETYQSQYAEEPVEGFVIKKNEIQSKNKRTITKLKRQAFRETRDGNINVDYFITINRLKNCYTKYGEDEESVIEGLITDVEEAIIDSLRPKIVKNATLYAEINLKNIKNQ